MQRAEASVWILGGEKLNRHAESGNAVIVRFRQRFKAVLSSMASPWNTNSSCKAVNRVTPGGGRSYMCLGHVVTAHVAVGCIV